MSDKGSVFQKGGGGTNFEQFVQTAFLTTLIIRGNVPCIDSGELYEVAFQVSNRGYKTDDFLATVNSNNGKHRLLIQVKHDISFTTDNLIFREVIGAFWEDFNNASIFDKNKDKLIVVKNGMTKDERNHLKSLFNWAKNKSNEADFISEVNRIDGKKKRLDIFREVLKKVNNEIDLSDRELWEFVKCVDVLEYDFLNDGSVDKAYFLNLIKLSRSKNSIATENEIWESILAYVTMLNPNGGCVTLDSIKDKDLFSHFDNLALSPFFKAVDKIKSDSSEILRPIKTTIGGAENSLHFQRTEIIESILKAMNDAQITILTGKPGVGKTAVLKEIIQKDFVNASVFAFRADQFNKPTLANVFSSQGVNESISDIFSCMSLIPEKIILIDSLEKLLEADTECAFKQLLALLIEHPEIKIIASSRKYAIDLITLKFGIDAYRTNTIDVPTLNEEELSLVSERFPQLRRILKNDKVKKLLQCPKYLDFSISAMNKTNRDYGKISLIEFKNELWNLLVADSANTERGLPIKREEAFMNIAVKRAKEMKLFIKPEVFDAEAVSSLERDEIIFQVNKDRLYSPTHDILEDWALVRYVSSKFEDFSEPKNLFINLGNEPAIRRAFRLWVEDYLLENGNRINGLIEATISDSAIERYWADEMLVAVFKSENSGVFFSFFEETLLLGDAKLLRRSLHVIVTCCREGYYSDRFNNLLIPVGSGWKEAVLFIKNHISELDSIKLSIINYLNSWHHRLLTQRHIIEKIELKAVKEILVHYIKEIEEGKEFWGEVDMEKKSKDLIKILLDLAEISQEEIKLLVFKASKSEGNQVSWKLSKFYENVIEKCLTGVGNDSLIKELPELIVDTAWNNWKLPPASIPPPWSLGAKIRNDSITDKKCWGIKDNYNFFPSGIYKTPIYSLLNYHPFLGINFIIEFINYSVDFYAKTNGSNGKNISHIELKLNDGCIATYWASSGLWLAYRGLSTTNYLLESLLMSLEKFLVEIASEDTDSSKELLNEACKSILRSSNNIAPIAVLASVLMAYPKVAGKPFLPILSLREFYEWDSNRAIIESQSFEMVDDQILFAQKERWNSNQLPHRRKYWKGLLGFVFQYQIHVQTLNKEIHEIFDQLKTKYNDESVVWKRDLTDIDIRNYRFGEFDEKLGGFPFIPEYEKDVADFVASNHDYIKKQNTEVSHSIRISNAYEEKEVINFEQWVESQAYYLSLDKLDYLYSKSITLANIGLKKFSAEISKEQKAWCLSILMQSILAILKDTYDNGYDFNQRFSLLEKDIALSSFHLIAQNIEDNDDKTELLATIIEVLASPLNDYEIRKVAQYIRDVFFNLFPSMAKRVWLGLILYSAHERNYPSLYRYQEENAFIERREITSCIIESVISDFNLKIEFSEIGLDRNSHYLLIRSLLILPFDSDDKDFELYIRHFLSMLAIDDSRNVNSANNFYRDNEKITSLATLDVKNYLSEYLLKANSESAISIFDLILYTSISNIRVLVFRERTKPSDHLSLVIENVIYKLDDIIANSSDEDSNKKLVVNFWILWRHFFQTFNTNDSHYLFPTLFLDIQWNENATHWVAFENQTDFYHLMVNKYGQLAPLSILNVLSTTGDKTFLPEGLSWLVKILKSNELAMYSLLYPAANRLIRRLFNNHISKIKSDKVLIEDYVWILNKMVDFGSSEAYFYRENVITYKQY